MRSVCLSIDLTNKNDRLYQGFTHYIHWSEGQWKNLPNFRLDKKNSFSLLHHYLPKALMEQDIILKIASDMMTMFVSLSNRTSYINGQRNCHYVLKHSPSLIVSFLTKALISGGNLCQNKLSQVGILTIIFGYLHSPTVLFGYSAIPKNLKRQAKAIFVQ